jgi:hypothetical protein
MSTIKGWLAGGDLRSDGAADQVVDMVLSDLKLLPEIIDGLDDARDEVRGRSADVLEKVGRHHPAALSPYLTTLIGVMHEDPVPMVRWHLAMLVGHLLATEVDREAIFQALIARLEDDSVFTISWAIVSLCILARCDPTYAQLTADHIRLLRTHQSRAVQVKVRHAMPLVTNPQSSFPKGWIKSPHLIGSI